MDPRYIGLTTAPVIADINLQCDGCQSIFLVLTNEGKPFSLWEIVRASLRHSCASVPAIAEPDLEKLVQAEVKEETDAMEAD